MFVVCFVHCFRIVYDANIIPNSEMNLKFYKNLFFLRRRSFFCNHNRLNTVFCCRYSGLFQSTMQILCPILK